MSAEKPCRDNICAVVVTYFPDNGFPERLAQIAAQVDRVVIVDNRSSPGQVRMLQSLTDRLNVSLLLNETNLGVGTALNQGVGWLDRRGYPWALTFDQDSEVLPELVENLCAVYDCHPAPQAIGVIGTNFIDSYTRRPDSRRTASFKGDHLEVKSVITSGSLTSVDVYHKSGPFREDFFIDNIDHEYCLRLLARGYKVLYSLHPGMVHSLGAQTIRKLLWRRPSTCNYHPIRHYYMTRNRLILARSFIDRETKWVLRDLMEAFRTLVLLLLFEEHKPKKIYAIGLGMLHALLGKKGKLDSRLLNPGANSE